MSIPSDLKQIIAEALQLNPELKNLPEDKLIKLALEAKSLHEQQLEDMSIEGLIINGEKQIDKGRFNDAEICLSKAVEKAEKENDMILQCSAYRAFGQFHIKRAEFLSTSRYQQMAMREVELPKAIEYLERALEIAEKIENIRLMGMIYSDMGIVSLRKENFDLAVEWFEKSLKLDLEMGQKERAANTYINLGAVYIKQYKNEDASKVLKKSISIWEEIGMEHKASTAYHSLGVLHINSGNLEKGIEFLEKAKACLSHDKDK